MSKKIVYMGLLLTGHFGFMFGQIGRVGINTTTPAAMLHVKDSSVVFTGLNSLPVIPGALPVNGTGTRMMWYADKAAFRAGGVNGTQWNKDSIGSYSIAMGYNTKAKGNNSLAVGFGTQASGLTCVALGQGTQANNFYSTAMGYYTAGIGSYSIATGAFTRAVGDNSSSAGFFTVARPYLSFVMGQYNDTSAISSVDWILTDPLFIIGNGTGNNVRKNAMTILKNGKTGINTSAPLAMLHVKDSSVVFTGTNPLPASPGSAPINGPGTRMMWYPGKAAFRAGFAVGSEWNSVNIGNYSLGVGYDAKASGSSSIAMGSSAYALGDNAVALGYVAVASGENSCAIGNYASATNINSFSIGSNTYASGNNAIALGGQTESTGPYSTAMGYQTQATSSYSASLNYITVANGYASTAMNGETRASASYSLATGRSTIAKSYVSSVFGTYNDSTSASSITWVSTDPLFIIGNGTSNTARSNAMTVLKNGHVGIGTIDPQRTLHVSNGTSGGTPHSSAAAVFEDNTSTSINLMTPSASTSSIYFGNEISANHGGILYNAATALNGFSFRTNGNSTKMTIQDDGKVGIGTSTPSYQLELSTNSAGKPTSNTWTIASDARLKKDVHDYDDGLEKLLAIHPVWFTYTGEAGLPQETGVGVLAQELKEIAPYMVGTWTHKEEDGSANDYLSVDNGAMVYMLINAVKEQQKMIDDLKHEVEELKRN